MSTAVREIPFVTSSILGNYIQCKLSFLEFYKNDGYASYRLNDDDGDPIYLTFGTLMHGIIEQFWKHPKTRTKRFLIYTYEQDIISLGFVDKEYIDLGYQIIDNFFNYLLNEAPKRKLVHSELSFKVTISGVPLHGTIDAIFYLGDGIYEIEDYKTSRYVPRQDEVDENVQLSMYDLVFSNDEMKDYWFNGIKPKGIILTLHYLRHDVRMQTERTEYSRFNALTYFRLLYNQMRMLEDDKFKPTLNKFCTYCDHAEICPLYQSVVDDTFTSDIDEEQDPAVYSLAMFNELNSRIKILTDEMDSYHNAVYSYLDKTDSMPIELDGMEYFLSQQSRRYVRADKALEILKENNLWNGKDYISIPVGVMDKLMKDNPDIESDLSSTIGYSYSSPKITCKVLPKLFKKSRSRL